MFKDMKQTFDEIITSLLEDYEGNPEQDIDALIEKKCKEWNFTEDQMSMLKEVNDYLDGFAVKRGELAEARSEGKTRKSWVLGEVDAVLEGRSEDEKASFVSAVSDTLDTVVNETLTKE